jgi:hypothetical protein
MLADRETGDLIRLLSLFKSRLKVDFSFLGYGAVYSYRRLDEPVTLSFRTDKEDGGD